MTRKTAIKLLFSTCAGFFVELVKSQSYSYSIEGNRLIEFYPGDVVLPDPNQKEKDRAAYRDCKKQHPAADGSVTFCNDPDHPSVTFSFTQYVPGTAKMVLKLDGWKSFEVEMGGKTITITRQDLWDALNN